MTELQLLLERSTDRIESPDLVVRALAGARRRRTARRTVLAAGAAAVLVIVVAFAGQFGGCDSSAPPVAPTPTPSTGVQDWDPRDAGALDLAAGHLADPVDPPSSAPALADQPLSAALLATTGADGDPTLYLLGTDGTWRSVPREDTTYAGVDLSADGTRLAVETTEPDGVDVWDLATGEVRHLDPPRRHVPWEFQSWTWVDDATLLFADGAGGWRVDARTGACARVEYPDQALDWDLDEDGAVVQSADFGEPRVLSDWAGGERRDLDLSEVGRLTSLAADEETVAGTTYENRPFAVVALDRDDLALQAVLPIRDPTASYSNGGLQVVGLRDDGTVLLRVTSHDVGPRERSWQLVAWDPATGGRTLVAWSVAGTSVPLSLAGALLG
jgi:hypothetical protein